MTNPHEIIYISHPCIFESSTEANAASAAKVANDISEREAQETFQSPQTPRAIR